MSEEAAHLSRLDDDILLDLNFVPQWAKKAPTINHYASDDRSDRHPSPRDRQDGARHERSGDRRDRPSRPPPERSSDRRHSAAPDAGRPPLRNAPEPRRQVVSRPDPIELPIEIKFFPEQQWLASMVRQIRHSKRAYPLMDLASLFLSDPKGHWVKMEILPGAKEFKLYQAKRSKIVSTHRDGLIHQLLDEHLEDFFVKENLAVEPPSGVFLMIGKIGDVLIGPTNHHSYAARLQEIYHSQFSGLPFDRFKQKVETVRDEGLIARWKEQSSKKTVYRLKEAPEGAVKEFTLAQAEDYIRTHIAEVEIEEVTRAALPSALARNIKEDNLIRKVREAWERESRFPQSVTFALRAAFRHMRLQIFKAGNHIHFVTAVKPDPINPEKAVEPIRLVLEYLADHPGSTREQMVKGLRPGAANDSPQAHEILNPLRWLIEKGHIIEFFNGTLSVPKSKSSLVR